MSAPDTAPETATAENTTQEEQKKKFEPKDFPADLRAAQLGLAQLYAELHAHQKRLPWSREEHEGWPEITEHGRERDGRPKTLGWSPEDAETYDRLWKDLRKAAEAVQAHPHWQACEEHGVQGADLVDLRVALKHAEGAVPMTRTDVDTAA